jgi:putative endonuclease
MRERSRGRESRIGREGEGIARQYLRERGFELLHQNYRCEGAEVDIVAKEGEVLVFCEVKMRVSDEFGPPEDSITHRKQRQIRKAALGYVTEHQIEDRDCRFDVVAIEARRGVLEIRHWRDAF